MIRTQLIDDGGRPFGVKSSKNRICIYADGPLEHVHHEIHEGNVYHAYRGDTLATNDTIMIAVTTPNTIEEQHMFWELYSSGSITFSILENVTSYTGGTAQTPINNNRRSDNTSNCTVKVGSDGALADPIVPTGGTVIDQYSFGSGNKSGGTASHEGEFVLERDHIDIYKILAVGNGIVCDLHLSWYEHTP
jgi:hypothetical protein